MNEKDKLYMRGAHLGKSSCFIHPGHNATVLMSTQFRNNSNSNHKVAGLGYPSHPPHYHSQVQKPTALGCPLTLGPHDSLFLPHSSQRQPCYETLRCGHSQPNSPHSLSAQTSLSLLWTCVYIEGPQALGSKMPYQMIGMVHSRLS